MTNPRDMVNVRYMVDDVEAAIAFYTKFLGFEVLTSFPPAFADVKRGNLRLLLSGPTSSAGRPMPDGVKPGPGGWNRIHLLVDDIQAEVAQLRSAGAHFRNDIISRPGGKRIRLRGTVGDVLDLFEPAAWHDAELARGLSPPRWCFGSIRRARSGMGQCSQIAQRRQYKPGVRVDEAAGWPPPD